MTVLLSPAQVLTEALEAGGVSQPGHAAAVVVDALLAETTQGVSLRTALLGLTRQQWGCSRRPDQPGDVLYPYDQWTLRETAVRELERTARVTAVDAVLVVRDVSPWREIPS